MIFNVDSLFYSSIDITNSLPDRIGTIIHSELLIITNAIALFGVFCVRTVTRLLTANSALVSKFYRKVSGSFCSYCPHTIERTMMHTYIQCYRWRRHDDSFIACNVSEV